MVTIFNKERCLPDRSTHKQGERFLLLLLFLISLCLQEPASGAIKGPNLSFDSFSQEDGLPNNLIQCIFQDKKGWMWFGTSTGLSRFDGYRFRNFLNNASDTTSLTGNLVRFIYEDRKGRLLIGTENGTLNVFDRERERFSHPYRNHPFFKNTEVSFNAATEDNAGNLWIGTNLYLYCLDPEERLHRINPVLKNSNEPFPENFIRVITLDRDNNLWLGTNNGLYKYLPGKNIVEPVPLPDLSDQQNKEIWEIFMDDDGSIWVGTYSSGAYIIDPSSGATRRISLEPFIDRTETVRTITKDYFGNYWIGTRGGLFVYSKKQGITGFYKHDNRDRRSLSNNSILDVFHDSRGETWIGTRNGINLLSKSKQVFRNFTALPNDNHYLNSSIIYAFWIDKSGKIWIGTEDGGVNIFDPVTDTFSYLTADPKNPNSLSQNCIKALLDDHNGNLWIGTFLGGIDVLDLKTNRISHYRHDPANPGSLSDNRVWALCSDKNQDIWVGTSTGLEKFDKKTGNFIHYSWLSGNQAVNWINTDSEGDLWMGTTGELIIYNSSTEKTIRYNEHSRAFLEDSGHRFWITTLDRGIALYSKNNGAINYLDEGEGLSNNQALCILEDNRKMLWVSTSNGLTMIDPETSNYRNFTVSDGLQNNQFSYGAALKSKNGELLFGGISGFNIFKPDEILSIEPDVPIVFTDLRIFNKSVPIGEGRKPVLDRSISETNEMVLRYDQNVFTLEFAALNYVNSANNLYSYFLEGFDKGWNEPSTIRTATYTNLFPDSYFLRVKRVIPGSQESLPELTLKIIITPPYWKTWWFRILLFLFISVLIYILIRFFINREKLKNELVFERVKAKKLHELDMLKLKFFTNISHEIRTPLTLILGPLEKLIAHKAQPDEIQPHLGLIYRNAKHLDNLINQLLDFRKLESGNLKLDLTQSDMVSFVDEVVRSFGDLANEKDINLKFNSLKKKLNAEFDPDKLEKILNNLLSNAFKFTPRGGTITVNLSLIFDSDDEVPDEAMDKQFVEITVKDNGIGIEEVNLEKIFTRFFQEGKESDQSGTGIGLALVKELVKLHNGKVFVTSKPGKGSKFTVRIPFLPTHGEILHEINPVDAGTGEAEEELALPSAEKENLLHSRLMLLVEDNADVRFFIRSHFSSSFEVREAKNGIEGWDTALNTIPDIIISDILMPDMDGYEFCRKIKKDERTSHIPVILLTALHSKEHEIEGLSIGADDYITKPFDINVLQAKVDNILSIRNSLKEKYAGEILLQPKNLVIASPDEKFLQKSIAAVENNISDAELDIERFAAEVGVSRMQLYRKLHALTDMTVKEFIRNIRLKRAAQLLLQKKLTVSEIAFEVGFRDLSHFRKCFRQEFGMSATEYVGRNSGDQILPQ